MQIAATEYVRDGEMMVLRSALNPFHPESWESLWTKKYGTIAGFPWEELYKNKWKEAKEQYYIESKARTENIGKCPVCGSFFY